MDPGTKAVLKITKSMEREKFSPVQMLKKVRSNNSNMERMPTAHFSNIIILNEYSFVNKIS